MEVSGGLYICIYIYNFIHFIYFWLCWIFVAAQAFLQLWQAGATLQLQCAGSRACGLSSSSSWALEHMGSVVVSWEIDGETVETVADFIFLGTKITADGDCSHEIKRRLLAPWKESYYQPGHTLALLIPGQ